MKMGEEMKDIFNPSVAQLPFPDYIWSGPEHLAVVYSDHDKFYQMNENPDYPEFSFLTGGKFIYDKKREIFLRAAGRIKLFEGMCYIYLQHAIGKVNDDYHNNDAYEAVDDFEQETWEGKIY
jgi:hypothetical protein